MGFLRAVTDYLGITGRYSVDFIPPEMARGIAETQIRMGLRDPAQEPVPSSVRPIAANRPREPPYACPETGGLFYVRSVGPEGLRPGERRIDF